MPKMPDDLRGELSSSGLSENQIETIIDNYDMAQNYIKGLKDIKDPEVRKVWSQGITNNKKIRDGFIKQFNDQVIQHTKYAAQAAVAGEINSNQFNDMLEQIVLNKKRFEELNVRQISEESGFIDYSQLGTINFFGCADYRRDLRH
jgi:hypothetical protein